MLGRLQALMRHSRDNPQADGKLIVVGTSVPSDGSTGYQTGCIYQKTDGSAGTSFHVNEGTLASSAFATLSLPSSTNIDDLADVGAVVYTAGKVLVADGDSYEEVAVSGDATLASTGALTIATGAIEDSMIEGLSAGQIILGVDGTAANNLKAVLSSHVTMDNTGAVTLATVTKDFAIALTDLRITAAMKDALPDTPAGDGLALGLGDSAGSPVLGTSTNNTDATEHTSIDYVVPADYVTGNDLTVRISAYVSAVANAVSDLDVVAKLVKGGALDATDLCLTGPIDIKAVTSAANHDFTIDNNAAGDELAPGSVLNIHISLQRDDTGGSTAGVARMEAVTVRVPCYR